MKGELMMRREHKPCWGGEPDRRTLALLALLAAGCNALAALFQLVHHAVK